MTVHVARTLPLLLLLLAFAVPVLAETRPPDSVDGWLIIDWGDPPPENPQKPVRQVLLANESGHHRPLEMSDELAHGPVSEWHGRRVRVFLRDADAKAGATPFSPLYVAAVQLLAENEAGTPKAAVRAVTGSQPWISILCKFSDIGTEPKSLSFFQNMYANSSGRLDHYWREVSGDVINVVGSIAIDWLVLPSPRSTYVPNPGSGEDSDRTALFNDCTGAADPFIDFANGGNAFVGINMMFNDVLDCCAWGGGRFATLDGVTKVWRTTWEPPWAYANVAVIEHEMGHGFGLPHSTNWDDDGFAYDSAWDVMSSATGNSPNDATYGRIGKHTIGYHKDRLGWIPAAQKLVMAGNGVMTIVLDDTVQNDSTNYRLVELPLNGGSTWYNVETRKRRGVYESSLPGEAVLIFHVDPSRKEPAWLFDADTPAAGFADTEGSMWRVGETFTDVANQISIRIDAETADGFQITIDRGLGEIFTDGFESGATSRWSGATTP